MSIQTVNRPEFNYGLVHFDDIFNAFLTLFQVLLGEGWTQILYIVPNLLPSVLELHQSVLFSISILLTDFHWELFLDKSLLRSDQLHFR